MSEITSEILFEKFEIIECFKKDEHAAVYLANHIYLGKKIILKALNTETIPEKSKIERFKREAKIMAKLEHPNIIKVLDFGTFKQFFYISFEYFESKNLRVYLKDHSLSTEKKRDLLIQLFKGLAYAHKNQIIHRDIKPENILVDNDCKLKIGDFGLALALNDNFETGQYSIVGTPCYMSPEQVQGKRLTAQSDLFSAGIVVLELFTGKNPFLGADVNKTISNIINYSESTWNNLSSTVPEEIRTTLSNLLIKNPALRYKTAEDVLQALDIPPETIGTQKAAFYSNRKVQAVSAALILVTALLIIFALDITKPEQPNKEIPNKSLQNNDNTKTEIPEDINENVIAESKNDETVADNNPDISTNEIDKNISPDPARADEVENTENKVNAAVKFGSLFIECSPWAHIYLNDKKLETTPLSAPLDLQAGNYYVKLVHPDFPEYVKLVQIEPDETTNIKVNLSELFGYLSCKIFPWGDVYVDGKFIGQTPFADPVKVLPGKHSLKITNPNFPDYTEEIEITKEETVVVQLNLNEFLTNAVDSEK